MREREREREGERDCHRLRLNGTMAAIGDHQLCCGVTKKCITLQDNSYKFMLTESEPIRFESCGDECSEEMNSIA